MTTPSPTIEPTLQPNPFWQWVFANVPGARRLNDVSIGRKLTLGFAVLVSLIFLVIALAFVSARSATESIERTEKVRAPVALASADAQANLLRMLASARGYLALGDERFLEEFAQQKLTFREDLQRLDERIPVEDENNRGRLGELRANFDTWVTRQEELFSLRDDQLAREPAYALLATDGVRTIGQAIIDTDKLIEAQSIRPASQANMSLLKDMADFQGSLAGMLSGLRNYVTTQNRIYRIEYEANLAKNNSAWRDLVSQRNRGLMTANQIELMDAIAANRETFLELPPSIFSVIEGERAREDLYQFRTEVVPQTEFMLDLLADMTEGEQTLLQAELSESRVLLGNTTRQIVAFGLLSLLLAVAMSLALRESIVGPVQRLTAVAERIRGGDLELQARVESNDETGVLASTFNRMTTRLRETLLQVRREKKRADDLLNVVIPIGVDLSAEKEFDRLLEKMLVEAKDFCRAEAGTLYLLEEDQLHYVIVRNTVLDIAMGGTSEEEIPFAPLPLYNHDGEPNKQNVATHAASVGETLNLPDVYAPDDLEFTGPARFDAETGYATQTMLTIPLQGSEGEVLGVLQLLNAHDEADDVVAFDENLQQMMESFSSLAAAALEGYIREQALRQEIKQLRIEIDEAKLQQQVSETVETDFFQDLQKKASAIRRRRKRAREEES